jgi:hypothetical protein
MVRWEATLDDGTKESGETCGGSWQNLSANLNKRKIVALNIGNEYGVSDIDNNADGYFIGNKLFAIMPDNFQMDFVGIGYWRKNDNAVRIKWHNPITMELLTTEAKNISECNLTLIKNI